MIIYPPTATNMALSNNQFTASKFRGGSSPSPRGYVKKVNKVPTSGKRQVVQWKQNNVKDGIVIVDESQLSKLIKTDPIENYYELDPEPFATGIFASVRRCKSLETGEVFAAKFSSRTRYGEDCSAEIHHEIALLSLCSPSPRIIRLHDVFQTPTVIIIVMEYAPGGDLQTIIDDNLVPFESDVVKFVQHVVEGLAYLHQRKIAHLDIKPQNLVMMGDFPNCDIKVCDFEISRVVLRGTEVREILGTPDYVAPEILHYEPITLAADIWSLGVTTYVLLTGFSPFGGETDQETFCNISQAQLDFPDELFEDVSVEAKDFIKRLLVRNPSERMSAKECLRHPWIMKHRKIPLTPAASRTNLLMDKPEIREGGVRGRVGCSSCSATPNLNKRNLRKYLSKSREALFEKVVSQHRLASELDKKENGSLRKSTLLNQYNKTRRLCESQMNLISKSRERQLLSEQGMSPNFSKSREKLYGLRSLSKSHEVLNLGLCAKIMKPANTGSSKHDRLIRAETPDLGALSTELLSIAKSNSTSQVDQVLSNRMRIDDDIRVGNIKSTNRVENVESNKVGINESRRIGVNESNREKQRGTKLARQDEYDDKENSIKSQKMRKGGLKGSVVGSESREQDSKIETELSIDKFTEETSPSCDEGRELDDDILGAGSSSTDSDDLSGSCENMSELVSTAAAEGEPEPRFTVKQLISAYNLHQEVVTKTSLEVTMNINDNQENKIIPNSILGTAENRKFPTGPNALRLFIPDIDIALRRTKKRSSKNSSITTIAEREENENDSETVDEGDVVEVVPSSSASASALVSACLNDGSSSECTIPDTTPIHNSIPILTPAPEEGNKSPSHPVETEEISTSKITSSTPTSKVKENSKKEASSSLENLSPRVGTLGPETTETTTSTSTRTQPPKLVRSLTESNVNRTQSCSTSFLRTLDKFNNMIHEESKININKPSPKMRRKSNPALMNKQYF